MTTMKRIVAVLLAVMLVASIGVLGASAAGETLTFDATGADAAGFTFTIYQVATLNTTTGQYTASGTVDSAVQTAINTPNQSGAAFLSVLNAATNVGTSLGTLKEAKKDDITTPGIYYAKVTDAPSTATKKLNTVVVWPQHDDGYTMSDLSVDLSKKVASGSDNVTKYFTEDTTKEVESKSAGQGDVINFTLEADVVGSKDEKVTKFVIWDKMTKGLTYNNDAKVYYDDSTTATTDFTVAAVGLTDSDAKYNGGTYITATANTVTSDSFYTHSKVYVKYSATVNNDATVGAAYNPNKDGLIYNTGSGNDVEKDGPELKVYTYEIQAIKYDGAASPKKALPGAKFGLYKGTTKLAEGTSLADGKVIFNNGDTTKNGIRLAPDTYMVKELEAPSGYALSTAEISVTISDTQAGTGVTFANGTAGIDNYPTKLPQTGGAGTMVFTIVGGALVLLAGAMFVIIMKKRASSK